MDIGTETETIVIEPITEPIPGGGETPAPEETPLSEPVPEREQEPVPA